MTDSASQLLLKIENLHKRFGDNVVLAGASLEVPRGSLVSVLGQSGAGKSVLLKCLADVIKPDDGVIHFDGVPLGKGGKGDPGARADFRSRCSFLFQSNALFDSLTALENVALPLEQTSRLPDKEIHQRGMEALKQLELAEHHDRFPSQLSGGMQKRLALARAIVTKPELVLFDEPTAGLDPLRRNSVFTMIAKYQRRFGFTALIVTHDVREALLASDIVALLNNGKMCFQGPPEEFLASTHSVVRGFRDSEEALHSALASIRRGETVATEDS
jgi:phospholipid/cholesterol/gamma-HCH transport system ATP-binding protein